MPTFQGQVSEEQLLLIASSPTSSRSARRPRAATGRRPGGGQEAEPAKHDHRDSRRPPQPSGAANYLNATAAEVVAADDATTSASRCSTWLDHRLLLPRRLFAVLIRLELLTPAGDLVTPETYNKLFTMHGVVMVFFFLIPSIPAVLGNFLMPIMIGAKDLAFPRSTC